MPHSHLAQYRFRGWTPREMALDAYNMLAPSSIVHKWEEKATAFRCGQMCVIGVIGACDQLNRSQMLHCFVCRFKHQSQSPGCPATAAGQQGSSMNNSLA